MSQALRILVAMLLLASCRFSFDNPAERLVPGEIRGRTAQEKEGESGSYKALSDVRVRMRGLPFVLETRDTGFFLPSSICPRVNTTCSSTPPLPTSIPGRLIAPSPWTSGPMARSKA